MKIPTKAKIAVREMQKHLKSQGIELTEEQTFKSLLEYNMLDRFGNPTKFALENGLAEVVEHPPLVEGMNPYNQLQDDADLYHAFMDLFLDVRDSKIDELEGAQKALEMVQIYIENQKE